MKMFGKNSNSDAAPAGGKRDVTIVTEPPKRPTSVTVETDDARWTVNLTLEEINRLGADFEEMAKGRGRGTEQEIMAHFIERMYTGSEGDAVSLTVEIKLAGPGEISMKAAASKYGLIERPFNTVRHADVGRQILNWIAEAQHRPDLVADLVAALADEQE